MMSTLLERYTDDDGNIQDEVVIKNCVGMAFAGTDAVHRSIISYTLPFTAYSRIRYGECLSIPYRRESYRIHTLLDSRGCLGLRTCHGPQS